MPNPLGFKQLMASALENCPHLSQPQKSSLADLIDSMYKNSLLSDRMSREECIAVVKDLLGPAGLIWITNVVSARSVQQLTAKPVRSART